MSIEAVEAVIDLIEMGGVVGQADIVKCLRTAIEQAEKQPAQRQWVGLTEKDFSAINQSCLTKLQAATSAESILKEKNHG